MIAGPLNFYPHFFETRNFGRQPFNHAGRILDCLFRRCRRFSRLIFRKTTRLQSFMKHVQDTGSRANAVLCQRIETLSPRYTMTFKFSVAIVQLNA